MRELDQLAPWLALPPTPDKFQKLPLLYEIPATSSLARIDKELRLELLTLHAAAENEEEKNWLSKFQAAVEDAAVRARERLAVIKDLAAKCLDFADVNYDFLYDKSMHLLTVGYTVDTYHHCDTSFYDLLGSESRLGVFVGIAQGKLPQESWFALGRRLTSAGDTEVLLSWSGSMFGIPHAAADHADVREHTAGRNVSRCRASPDRIW